MTDMLVQKAAIKRATELRQKMRRNRLVFVQLGAVHDVLRTSILESMSSTIKSAVEFLEEPFEIELIESSSIVLTEIEKFSDGGPRGSLRLGALRQKINEVLDDDIDVCMISRTPRASFGSVPGSSIIEDSSIYCLPLLDDSERVDDYKPHPAAALPCCGLGGCEDLSALFHDSLAELGVSVLAALDQAIFEAPPRVNFLDRLDIRDVEALRGAGLVVVNNEGIGFTVDNRTSEFREAVADVLAGVTTPQSDLPAIIQGLWSIERIIRRSLRDAAVSNFGNKWRVRVLHGDLPQKVLERARLDVHVSARSVSELRDPIEWLSLGELIEVANSHTFDGLKFDQIAWGKFKEKVMPIRNRISHMRLMRKGDKQVVEMWHALVHRNFS
ncbi:hypothetical protein ABZ863_12730 [Saccharomonospora sp. NPDC046836]|uniref:hypothetical protein n=1 Tax=Saccharomonospora sp. NPDC046836 TaxID=3156921 RepID=UPI0033C426D6